MRVALSAKLSGGNLQSLMMSAKKSFTTLIGGVSFRCQQDPQGKAFVFLNEDMQAQEVSNEQFYYDVHRYAQGLIAKGIQPGEVVLLALDHGYELLCCFWGAIYCGAIPSILTYWHSGSDVGVYTRKVNNLTTAVRAKAVLVLSDLYLAVTEHLNNINYFVFTPKEIINASGDNSIALPEMDSKQSALLQFTSGTTREPKAIQFSHKAILDHVKANATYNQITRDSVYVSWLPFYHDMGLINHVRHLVHGGPLVLMSPRTWLEQPVMLLKAVHRYKGMASSMPNFGFDYCVRHIRDEELSGIDLSSWRFLSNGSEPVALSSIHRFCERFGPYGFHPEALKVSYGMAENVAGVSTTPAGQSIQVDWVSIDDLQIRNRAIPVGKDSLGATAVVSCGYPYPGIDLAIVDDQWTKLSEREVGEIVIRANTLFAGYYLAPEDTKDLFRERWFRTGDIGYIVDGQIYVCGRKKDLIIVGGRNIQPQAIENIAADVFGPFAGRCAAFGVSDQTLGTELPVLVVEQRKQLENAEKQNLTYHVHKRVMDELDVAISDIRIVPRGWLIKTTSGKTTRAANREKYLNEIKSIADEEHKISLDKLTSEQVKHKLINIFENVLGIKGIGEKDNFFMMGGDSLSALRLLLAIESKFDQDVSVAEFFRQPTVECILEILCKKNRKETCAEIDSLFVWQNKNRVQQIISQLSALSHDLLKGIKIRIRQRIADIIPNWLYKQERVQRLLNADSVALMRRFYGLLEAPLQSEKEFIQYGLMFHNQYSMPKVLNTEIYSYRLGHWSLCVDMATLEQAYQQGNGVVIVRWHSHRWINILVKELVLERLSTKNYSFIGNFGEFLPKGRRKLSEEQQRRASLMISVDQLMMSKRILTHGGIVFVFPDANSGISNGFLFPFHGRIRNFKAGFAELAIRTGSAVIPISLILDHRTRQVIIKSLDPLNIGPSDMDYDVRVEGLVMKYVTFFQQEWARSPALIYTGRMRRHLAF